MPSLKRIKPATSRVKPYDLNPSPPGLKDDLKPDLTASTASTKIKIGTKSKIIKPEKISEETKMETHPHAPPSSTASSGTSPTKRSWSTDELMGLYEHVLEHGPRDWQGAVEGRNANQCYKVWIQTLNPYIKNSISSKKG